MIAPDFRVTENIVVLKPAKTFISFNYGKSRSESQLFLVPGDNMFKGMESELQGVETTHNSLTQVVSHKTDANQMAKFKDLYLQ